MEELQCKLHWVREVKESKEEKEGEREGWEGGRERERGGRERGRERMADRQTKTHSTGNLRVWLCFHAFARSSVMRVAGKGACVCVCLCMCVCVCARVHDSVPACVCAWVCFCVRACMSTCLYGHMWACIYALICMYIDGRDHVSLTMTATLSTDRPP